MTCPTCKGTGWVPYLCAEGKRICTGYIHPETKVQTPCPAIEHRRLPEGDWHRKGRRNK